MKFQSVLAIYILFWTMTLFVVLPFSARTDEEAGAQRRPGHAESAPHRFSFAQVALRTTLVSALIFGLFYANYHAGWVTIDMLDWSRWS
jgi:predicted secreted protein